MGFWNKKPRHSAIIAQDLTKIMLEKRAIPVANYQSKKEYELIVAPRSIRGHDAKKKKSLKW